MWPAVTCALVQEEVEESIALDSSLVGVEVGCLAQGFHEWEEEVVVEEEESWTFQGQI